MYSMFKIQNQYLERAQQKTIATHHSLHLLHSECRQVWPQSRSGRGNKNRNNCLSVVLNLRRQMLTFTTVLTFPDWHALNCMSLN